MRPTQGRRERIMSNLTFIKGNDVSTTSLLIASELQYAHKDITAHIAKHRSRLEQLGNFYAGNVKINTRKEMNHE